MWRKALDRTTLIAILYRVAPGPMALGVILLIAHYFTLEQQAFYYMVVNFFAILQLSDLGLSVVLVQFCAHEWYRIKQQKSGRLTGDPIAIARLASIAHKARTWYGSFAAIYLLGVGSMGFFFLRAHFSGYGWVGPWFFLVPTFSLILFYTYKMAILEGCGSILQVYIARLSFLVAGIAAFAIGITLGLGLWAICLNYAVFPLVIIPFCDVRFRNFFRSLVRTEDVSIDWMREVWPLQWSLSINVAASYLLYQLYVPIVLLLVGAAAAGKTGMTVQMINMINMMASALITSRVPVFAGLIAGREFKKLDALFLRVCIASLALTVTATVVFLTAVWCANYLHLAIAARMLPPLQTTVFAMAMLVGLPSQFFGPYLIAHKKNPILWWGLVSGVSNLAAVFVFVKLFGTIGAGIATLVVNAFIMVPWQYAIWRRSRRLWHAPLADSLLDPQTASVIS